MDDQVIDSICPAADILLIENDSVKSSTEQLKTKKLPSEHEAVRVTKKKLN
jgi:hypothetical protein